MTSSAVTTNITEALMHLTTMFAGGYDGRTRKWRKTASASGTNSAAAALVLLLSLVFTTIVFVEPVASSSAESYGNNGHNTKFGLTMIRSPESIVAPLGDEVVFECALNVSPDRILWRFRHHNTSKLNREEFKFIESSSVYNISLVEGTSTLGIIMSVDTVGEYQCIALYGASALASVAAQLILASISLPTNGPVRTSRWRVAPGNSIAIFCGDIVSNPPAVRNYYKDKDVVYSEPEAGNGVLVLDNLKMEMSGTYWCSAMNSITLETRDIPMRTELIVESIHRMAPVFLSPPPAKAKSRLGQKVTLLCPGVGNPVPKVIWSRSNGTIAGTRAIELPHGLEIAGIEASDQGMYYCLVDNGITPQLRHGIELTVLEAPQIIKGPMSTLTNESDVLIMDCKASGSPPPEISWMINGNPVEWDNKIRTYGTTIYIETVEKSHAGIIQCFARNEVGEANDANWLKVNPKQIYNSGHFGPGSRTGYDGDAMGPLSGGSVGDGGGAGGSRMHDDHEQPPKNGNGKKKHKHPPMIPPSKPSVTRLSDESVMVRWAVSSDDGLPIQFFKVQFRMIGNANGTITRGQWMTSSEDIPPHLRSYEVKDLKPDHFYRFRIAAVYSNNDNKLGSTSGKFHLQRASQLSAAKSHLVVPILQKVEGISETEIRFYWSIPNHVPTAVVGFYAYFRPSSTAGEYSKATIDGMDVRHFTLNHLEPGTSYEFKLQSFTASAASDFSAILTGKTLTPPTRPPPIEATVEENSKVPTQPNYILIIGGCSIGLVLISIFVWCACKQQCWRRGDETATESKAHPADMADNNGFPAITNSLHKNHNNNRSINITSNPLATDATDKNRNVMELCFLQNSNVTTGGHPNVVGLVVAPPQQQPPPHVPNNHANYNNNALHNNNLHFVDGMPPRRKTLERNVGPPSRNMVMGNAPVGSGGNNMGVGGGIGGIVGSTGMLGIPSAIVNDIHPNSGASLRMAAARRNSGSNNLTAVPSSPRMMRSGISAELLHQHHKSPLPKRAVPPPVQVVGLGVPTMGVPTSNLKRNVITRNDHIMSSGSIEV